MEKLGFAHTPDEERLWLKAHGIRRSRTAERGYGPMLLPPDGTMMRRTPDHDEVVASVMEKRRSRIQRLMGQGAIESATQVDL